MHLSKKQILWSFVITFFFAGMWGVYRIAGNCVCVHNFWNFVKHKNLRIMVTSHPDFFGERASVVRISNSLSDMGYGAAAAINKYANFFARLLCVDFVINLRPEVETSEKFFNFLILHYADTAVPRRYDALLSVVPENLVKSKVKDENFVKDVPICPFYLSVRKTEFYDAPKKKLFFCGYPWDKFRAGHCKKTYKLLDQTGYFEVYGSPDYWGNLHLKSYKGLISEAPDALLHTMQKAGVTLVLHSDGHFKNNTSTARIFEALAASNVIICDRLPFITENFGDTVLYVDRDVSPEELFRQIDVHMQWILSHQEEAIEMARKSHEIFVKKFSLEMIMQNVIDFYLQQKRKR